MLLSIARMVMRTALLVLILGLSAPAGQAQSADPPRNKVTGEPYTRAGYVKSIRKRVLAARKLHAEGKPDRAYQVLGVLKEDIAQHAGFLGEGPVLWWPDLMTVRLKVKDKDYPAAEAAATPITLALDTDRHRQSETRMEAMLYLTKLLFEQKKHDEAYLMARGLLQDAPADLKPKWRLDADVYLALAATYSAAPDAAAIRAALLAEYLQRETATMRVYLHLWRVDLNQRRKHDPDKDRLLLDARNMLDFIRTDKDAQAQNLNRLEATLARIFGEAKDFKRAEPLLRKRLVQLEPGSVEYYWGWQNLLAMNYAQKKYTQVLQDTGLILSQLEGKDDTYALVTSSLLRYLAHSARELGDSALFQDAIERSYIEVRRVRSANHPDATLVRGWINIQAVDPDTFPYADELGVERRKTGKLTLTADGTAVLQEVLAGRAISLGRRLKRFVRKEPDTALGHLNLGLYHGLMGEIGPAEAAFAQVGQTGDATDPWPDLFLALTYGLFREWQPELALPALTRLQGRSDLSPTQTRLMQLIRANVALQTDQFDTFRAIYETHFQDHDPRTDHSPWGVLTALGLVPMAYRISTEHGHRIVPKVAETLERAGNPKLASSLLQVYRSNADPGYLLTERNFQTLGYHVQALSRMLPPEHQVAAIAKLSFAYGLWNRQRFEEALHQHKQAVSTYKSSPWHRADAVGYLEVEQADLYFVMGQADLAMAIIAQAYKAMDRSYRPAYWQKIFSYYVLSLTESGKFDQALATTRAAVADPDLAGRFAPSDLVNFYITHATALEKLGHYDDALIWLGKARDAIPHDAFQNGGPLAQVMISVAYVNYNSGRYGPAYAAMAQATDIYFRTLAATSARDGSGTPRDLAREKEMVVNQAHFAWQLSQQLRASGPAQ